MAYPGPARDEPLADRAAQHRLRRRRRGRRRPRRSGAGGRVARRARRATARATARPGRTAPGRDELVALRTAVRAALTRAAAGERVPARGARRDQRTPRARAALAACAVGARRAASRGDRLHGATRADIVLAAIAARRDRPAHRPAARRAARVRRARLRAAVRQGPPAPRVVLERLRQPRPPGAPLPPHARRRLVPARERARQPEPREHAVLEAGHGADPVAGEGEDEEADPVADAVGGAQVGAERRLAVGARRARGRTGGPRRRCRR